MNKQEIFDRAIRPFIKQGIRATRLFRRHGRGAELSQPVTRGLHGRMCPLGWLLPDRWKEADFYDRWRWFSIRGTTPEQLEEFFALTGTNESDLPLLRDLQSFNEEPLLDWEFRLEQLASEHSLRFETSEHDWEEWGKWLRAGAR